MEVYPRSSWFLLLLGFALIAATLQETTDCPTPDQVSCTSGVKCSSNEDCENTEICCANSCYTKRCIPIPKGVQGEAETDGPSETDCRPYIEKALKELEIGEAGHVHKEPLEKDESGEDVPTVEITDDSSHQEEDGGVGEASDESEGGGDKSVEQVQQESVQKNTLSEKSEEVPGETLEEEEAEKSEEKAESEEQTKEPSKEESAEETDQAGEASVERESKEEIEVQQKSSEKASVESQETGSPDVIDDQIPVAPAIPIEAVPVLTTIASKEDDQSDEKPDEKSAEDQQQSVEEQDVSQEAGVTAPQEKSQEESVEETAKSKEDSGEEGSKEDDKTEEKSGETEAADEVGARAVQENKSGEQTADSTESIEEGGCPPPNQVSCTEGELCTKHRHCGENQICCPNKCYRRRCTLGTVSQAELDEESASEESEEAKSEEKTSPSTPETGCPSPNEVTCDGGDLCSKHRQCGADKICCTNKCYRKRCIPGTPTSAELAEESDEDSREDEKIESTEKKPAGTRPETGCPSPNEVTCAGGDLCNKHRQCGADKICCTNKCYRKRCIPGTPTSAELAEESEEDSREDEKIETAEEKPAEIRPETGCPAPNEVSCVKGELCSKHKDCVENEICCPNKCYRKRCTPGTPTEDDLAGEESEEETKEEESKGAAATSAPRKESGCPERNEVPCGGKNCNKNKECDTGEICCANKCYRKVCTTGTPGSEEEEEEGESGEKTKVGQGVETSAEAGSKEDGSGCPSPDKVSCKEGEKCGVDDDCNQGEICCPNKCYNKRCISGVREGEDRSSEEEKLVEEPPPPPPPPKAKVPEKEKIEIKKEVKPTLPPPEPKREPKKIEMKKPDLEIHSKPVTVVKREIEEDESLETGQDAPVEELSIDIDVPTDLRPREHVEHLLKLDQDSTKLESVQNKVYEETLKELKRLYENAIKPLEVLYKYRDLSNRHFGDAEIFSKPLILFMGPWSGGKSSIINYLLDNEYNETSLRTGAEPSPAYFNILMYGDEPEIIDGTELAADFTFSGLQKFGQGLEERLRGVKLPAKLLEKVNIVEIPGILEVRKQVSRVFPFNDACQWFIDRADIIFLVYDPSKLDVGPETEAILDQLKGREHQTRIILNKADQVKPEELMRVQGALIWNISPLMSSPQPPAMYTTSLWSRPYEPWAPTRLLQAQERAFLRDLRTAIDRRVENKIASARRFAVRVRNHAKMVDCYLTTYYNHKSVFGNRKQVANEIIENPQDYHIYEGLSTLTNISRYDLPDPDVYRDFFKLNPLYEFQQLSATCTYFRGCPINRLDIAIAYDLPELIGTYKRNLEEAITTANNPPKESSQPTKKTKKSAPGS